MNGVDLNLWYRDLSMMSDNDVCTLHYYVSIGLVPLSDWYNAKDQVTWKERCEQIRQEYDRRGFV